jgi:hypothetical protein
MKKREHIHIKRRIKERDFECTYNGVKGYADTAVMAFRNAKRNYEIRETSNQLEIVDADFNKTLESVRI